jgi:hypothetical protein
VCRLFVLIACFPEKKWQKSKRNTARHVAQRQSGIMLPHSKEEEPLNIETLLGFHQS